MIGFDKSRYQTPGIGPWGEFCYVQAGRGRDPGGAVAGTLDPRCSAHVAAERLHGVPVSLYWRVFPDLSLENQADLMAHAAERDGISTRVTLWLDLENPTSSEPWPGDAAAYEAAYVGRVNSHGWPCGTYANESFWRTRGIRGTQGRIVAKYNANNGAINGAPPAVPWDIWQFTSRYVLPAGLDANTASAENVARLFGLSGTTKPPQAKVFDSELELAN